MTDRIRAYVDRAPEAISGSGGHATTLRVARSLFNGFGLSRQETLGWLRVYNARLRDKWTDRELEHKADSAANASYDKPRGWMLATLATLVSHTQPAGEIVVRGGSHPPIGAKRGKKYVLATLATLVSHTQPTVTRAPAHARADWDSKISVATVPKGEPWYLAPGAFHAVYYQNPDGSKTPANDATRRAVAAGYVL